MVIDAECRLRYSAVIVSISAVLMCLCAGAVPSTQAADAPATDYAEWVGRYSKTNLNDVRYGDTSAPVMLVVTQEGERYNNVASTYSCAVYADGTVWSYSRSAFDTKGGGGKALGPDDLKRLDSLLAQLPDDGARLPPAERRILLQARVGDHIVTRVYDRANFPDVVWEILCLGRCGISEWIQSFKSQSEINAREYKAHGFLRVSPDGKKILFASDNGPLQLWDAATRQLLASVPMPGDFWNSAGFSPDGSLLVVGGGSFVCLDTKTWKITNHFHEDRPHGGFYTLTAPRFTADGRYLFLDCNRPSLKILDLKSWQAVDRLPEMPEDAVQCVPAPGGQRALVRRKSGALVLWDTTRHRQIATLDEDAFVSDAAFSPDGSMVAVATAPEVGFLAYGDVFRVRIWKTSSGQLVRELRTGGPNPVDNVGALAWSPDGQYVLAAVRFLSSASDIGIFDVETGHQRGELTGCMGPVIGMAILPDNHQLVAGCGDGRIRFWNVENATKEIKAFTASLDH